MNNGCQEMDVLKRSVRTTTLKADSSCEFCKKNLPKGTTVITDERETNMHFCSQPCLLKCD